jgi:hypothetical protein
MRAMILVRMSSTHIESPVVLGHLAVVEEAAYEVS